MIQEQAVSTLIDPVSGSADVEIFIEIPQVPVLCNALFPTREEALAAPKGDLLLGFSRSSGHVYNYAFDSGLMTYTQVYENSLHFSPRFQEFVTGLADRLIGTYDLREKTVIDIGCGKGDFLKLLCERGGNRGIGFDPSYEPELTSETEAQQFTVIQDLYSDKYAHYEADLISCRHVLEHIQDPQAFMRAVRQTIGDRTDTAVFFEVPNVRFTLRDLAIWDLIYEHVSYFSACSLDRLFRETGFGVKAVEEVYGGQYLTIEAFPLQGTEESGPGTDLRPEIVAQEVESFSRRYNEKVAEWRGILNGIERAGKKAVIWGSGSKGVTILNILQATDQIPYAVDINPRKQGKYIPGTGQRIVSPEFLKEYRPDVVIVMNPLYESEICSQVQGLGLSLEYILA
jgi:SAM-dependent methyltransferase